MPRRKAEVKAEPKVTRRKLADYQLDPQNPNKGTTRGDFMLESSVEDFGAGRSGVVDKDGVIRAGNHTAQQLQDAGIVDVIEIETTGKEWVIVKRLDMDAEAGQQYAIADNRTGQLIEWDPAVLAQVANQGLDLTKFWLPDELQKMGLQAAPINAPADFQTYDETIKTEHRCPKCGYEWSGNSQ